MQKGDTFKLRFGPFPPPNTRRGAKLVCQQRGTVTVGGYSDAPIPWPRVKKGGLPCLVLCGSLLRAVRREALITVAHHWGVSQTTVWKWRKLLGVERWNAGSRQLLREWEAGRDDDRLARGRATSHAPAARQKQSERMRGTMPPVPGRRPWTPEEHALLGTAPDAVIARRLGRTLSAVQSQRFILQIRCHAPRQSAAPTQSGGPERSRRFS